MQAVIPAAGEGTRLRPLTDTRPKALVEVAGRPILTHCFEQLLERPVSEFIVVVGYRGEAIVEKYGDSFDDVPLTYVWQHEQRGLAHALIQAADQVDEAVLACNGDNVFRANLESMVTTYRNSTADGVALVTDVTAAEARTTGAVVVRDGHIVEMAEIAETPPSTVVNAGCYVLPPAVCHACRLVQPGADGEYQSSDAIDVLCHAGYEILPVRLDGWRVNVNTPADVERADARLQAEE